jgi:hypothetical protein
LIWEEIEGGKRGGMDEYKIGEGGGAGRRCGCSEFEFKGKAGELLRVQMIDTM